MTLSRLASFEADIVDGNRFTTREVEVNAGTNAEFGLNPNARFGGVMYGAFFGSQGAEAGGTFSFGTTDHKDGAFRGAFGTARQPDSGAD